MDDADLFAALSRRLPDFVDPYFGIARGVVAISRRTGGRGMKFIWIIAIAWAVLVAGPAAADEAEAIIHTSPLPCAPMSGGGMFCGHTYDLRCRAEDGDQVLLKFHGYKGIELVGLPPFVREVPTTYGRLLRGAPTPGNYIVEMHQDGKRTPTLDMHMRFIPR
ncbi:hypothetical protein FHX10_003012 [Rhizobium sp. BK591]|uniref:hypothetical protein n=1 Tax=Rhizobium sp. BK591 TaxID=2586985 RepID=UPI001621AC96|nr:hypothetical protein [Rhizobium sp. BK591]MBB3743513.1 hypothetical protein [Rhizobium sp. BK591]